MYKCDKCGCEHNSRTVCPKCGAAVVIVNEDYLLRRRILPRSSETERASRKKKKRKKRRKKVPRSLRITEERRDLSGGEKE